MSNKTFLYGSFSAVPSYDPVTDTPLLELYLNAKTATPSSWLDQSPNAYNLSQSVVLNQPDTSDPLKVVFDGVTEFQNKQVSSALNYNIGHIFFSGYRTTLGTHFFLASGDTVVSTRHFNVGIRSTGEIYMQIRNGGLNDNLKSTNTVTVGDYFYGDISFDGVTTVMHLNGSSEVIIPVSGSNTGKGFSDAPLRDNLTVGALIINSVVNTPGEINKIVHSRAVLTAGEIEDLRNFMAVPSN